MPTPNNTLLANPLLAALQRIADAPANSNSAPDRMGAALDAAVALASDTVHDYDNLPLNPFNVFVPGQFPISIEQGRGGKFTVTYGAEVRDGMSYEEAGDHLGHAILHALACAGAVTDRD